MNSRSRRFLNSGRRDKGDDNAQRRTGQEGEDADGGPHSPQRAVGVTVARCRRASAGK